MASDKGGPSKRLEHIKIVMSISTQNKQDITNAMEVCRQILKEKNIIDDKPETEISIQPTVLGKRFAELIIDMLEEHDNVIVKAAENSSEDDDLSIEETSSTAENSSPKNVIKKRTVSFDIEKAIYRREQELFFNLRLLNKKRSGGLQNKGGIKKWKRHL